MVNSEYSSLGLTKFRRKDRLKSIIKGIEINTLISFTNSNNKLQELIIIIDNQDKYFFINSNEVKIDEFLKFIWFNRKSFNETSLISHKISKKILLVYKLNKLHRDLFKLSNQDKKLISIYEEYKYIYDNTIMEIIEK